MTLRISPHAIEQDQGPFIFPGILVGSGPDLPAVPDGTLHVWSGSAGAVTAHANADDLVVENDGMGGISILVPDVTWANIYFGQGAVNNSGFIRYGGVTHQLEFGVNQATIAYWLPGQVTFIGNPFTIYASGVLALESPTEIVVNNLGDDVDFRVKSDTLTHALFVRGSDGFVGVNIANPVSRFAVVAGADTWAASFFGAAAGNQVRIGTYGGVATIGANNNAGGAWADLAINPGGGLVGVGVIPTSRFTVDGGNIEIRSGWDLMLRPVGNAWDMRIRAVGTQIDFLSGGALGSPLMSVSHGPRVGVGISAGLLGTLHVDQSSTTAAIPVAILDQADISEGFINFIGSDRGVITGATNSVESVRVELGGVVRRLALYADA